jgi:hypothetical protein
VGRSEGKREYSFAVYQIVKLGRREGREGKGTIPATLLLLAPRELFEGEGCRPPFGVGVVVEVGVGVALWVCFCCCCLTFLDFGEAGVSLGELLAPLRGSADPTFLMLLLGGPPWPPGFSMAATEDHLGGWEVTCKPVSNVSACSVYLWGRRAIAVFKCY